MAPVDPTPSHPPPILPASATTDPGGDLLGEPIPRKLSPWEQTFQRGVAASHLMGDHLEVLLVPAGTMPEQATEATKAIEALRSGLERSGRELVIKRARSIRGTDEAKVVRSGLSKGFDRVAVVRVFDHETQTQVIVTIYGPEGQVIGAFTAYKGQPMPVNDDAGRGISVEASLAVIDSTKHIRPDRSERERDDSDRLPWQEAYDRRFIGFGEGAFTVGVDAEGNRVMGWSSSDPYKGVHRQPLEGADFYRYLGRNDLENEYLARTRRRRGLITAGSLLLAGGTTAGSIMLFMGNVNDRRGLQAGGGTLMGLGVGGAVLLTVGLNTSQHPVDHDQMRKLADQFNRKLERRLQRELSMGLSGSSEGGSIVLRGRF